VDVNTCSIIRTFVWHTSNVNSITFGPDSFQLASASADRTIKLWDVNTGSQIRTFEDQKFSVNSVTFDPGGSYLASGSGDVQLNYGYY